MAQLDSASDSDSEGRRFESFRAGQRRPTRTLSLSVFFLLFHGFRTSCCCFATAIICAILPHFGLVQIKRANIGSESLSVFFLLINGFRTSCCCKATAKICALPPHFSLAQMMRANVGSESFRSSFSCSMDSEPIAVAKQ